MGMLELYFLGVDWHVALDPFVTDLFNAGELRQRDAGLVAKVEAQLCRGYERTSLVDVVSKDFAQGKIEDMSARVIVADWSTAVLLE